MQLDAPTIGMRATPLIFAAKMVYNKCVELLLNAGANVNYIDSSGRSALHWAAAVNNIQAMELLIKHGANKDCTSSKVRLLHWCYTCLMLHMCYTHVLHMCIAFLAIFVVQQQY